MSDDDVVFIARCAEHGLHGERDECFICGGPVEKVAMRLVGAEISYEIRRFDLLEHNLLVLRIPAAAGLGREQLEALRQDLRHGLHDGTRALVTLGGELGGRFDVFTLVELQALVFAFASAHAYDDHPPSPFDLPVWSDVATEAGRTLDRAAADDGWDERTGLAAS